MIGCQCRQNAALFFVMYTVIANKSAVLCNGPLFLHEICVLCFVNNTHVTKNKWLQNKKDVYDFTLTKFFRPWLYLWLFEGKCIPLHISKAVNAQNSTFVCNDSILHCKKKCSVLSALTANHWKVVLYF